MYKVKEGQEKALINMVRLPKEYKGKCRRKFILGKATDIEYKMLVEINHPFVTENKKASK